jgi:hypothetical protein
MKALRNGTLGEYLPVKMRAIAGPGTPITGQEVPITGQHFLTYRWEQTSVADGTYWIHRIPLPILLVRDQADGLVQPFEPYQLLSAAHSEGSLVTNVRGCLKSPDSVIFHRLCFPIPASKQLGRTLVRVP